MAAAASDKDNFGMSASTLIPFLFVRRRVVNSAFAGFLFTDAVETASGGKDLIRRGHKARALSNYLPKGTIGIRNDHCKKQYWKAVEILANRITRDETQ
jgi:hypothetical protein